MTPMTALFRLPIPLRHATLTISALRTPRSGRLQFSGFSKTGSVSDRTYADAVELLDMLQSNRAITTSIASGRDVNADAIPDMLEWTKKAGYEPQDFSERGLRFIHVAGTKGKGSTCVMVDSVLQQYQRNINDSSQVDSEKVLGKIGLYTSPHLVTVRERIRIDGKPISELLFARYFFEIWDRLSKVAVEEQHPRPESPETKPGYFRYLTIMAFHVFMEERVQSAIIECGIGGEYDSTNILPSNSVTVTAITRLGVDHIGMLGETLKDISWHKAGIMKPGVPAFTVKQESEAQNALNTVAREKGVDLTVVERLPILNSGEVKLGLDGKYQQDNASLAVAIAASHLNALGLRGIPSPKELLSSEKDFRMGTHGIPVNRPLPIRLPEKMVAGLESTTWQGRWQTLIHGNIEWLIDGAHTMDSIEATAAWYAQQLEKAQQRPDPPTATMLIFNQQERDGTLLVRRLIRTLEYHLDVPNWRLRSLLPGQTRIFTYAAFCTNQPFKSQQDGARVDLHEQTSMARVYQRDDQNDLNMVYESVEEAVGLARRVSDDEDDRLMVLVTGSLHLVGALMKVLEKLNVHGETIIRQG